MSVEIVWPQRRERGEVIVTGDEVRTRRRKAWVVELSVGDLFVRLGPRQARKLARDLIDLSTRP